MSRAQLDFPLPTVREFLEWPSILRGQPKVVAGRNALDQRIRWVHSSEIRDIAPLLKGGEVLLTTGLGLAGSSTAAHERYIASLKAKKLAALVLELGRSFSEAPKSLLNAARAHSLPMIVLDRVVPFVAITEEANARALNASRAFVEIYHECTSGLFQAINGDDPDSSVIAYLESFCGGPVTFSEGAAPPVLDPDRTLVSIRYRGTVRFNIELPVTNGVRGMAVAQACEHALPAWHRTRIVRPFDRVSSLVEVLMREGSRSSTDVMRRLSVIGLPMSPQQCCIPVVFEQSCESDILSAILHRVTSLTKMPAVTGSVSDATYLLALAPIGVGSWPLAEHIRQALHDVLRRKGVVGTPCDAGALSFELKRTTALLKVAIQSSPRSGFLHVEQLLTASLLLDKSDVELAALSRSVEPIARQDAVKGTKYLDTLDAFLERGGHISDVAVDLGLSRQSLYQRLERIGDVLGAPLTAPGRLEALRVAVAAASILKARAATVVAHEVEGS